MLQTPTAVEIAAVTMASRLRSEAEDIVAKLVMVCPSSSLIRTAGEMRAVARSLQLAAEHIIGNAEVLEASHAG